MRLNFRKTFTLRTTECFAGCGLDTEQCHTQKCVCVCIGVWGSEPLINKPEVSESVQYSTLFSMFNASVISKSMEMYIYLVNADCRFIQSNHCLSPQEIKTFRCQIIYVLWRVLNRLLQFG